MASILLAALALFSVPFAVIATPGATSSLGEELASSHNGVTTCTEDDDTLCLMDSRFKVSVSWDDGQGGSGEGQVVPTLSNASGLFYFFQEDNWEMLVKTINACGFNQHFWVYAAATTDREYELSVVDTSTGAERLYRNELGERAPAVADNKAFPCGSGDALERPSDEEFDISSSTPLAGVEGVDMYGKTETAGAVYTVGPAGTYSSLQAALDAVVAADGKGDVRIQATTLVGTTLLETLDTPFDLTITGGWNESFAQRSLEAGDTVLDGDEADTVLELRTGMGSILVEGLRLTRGRSSEGGGMVVFTTNTSSVRLVNLEIDQNQSTGHASLGPGGASLFAAGSSELFLFDSFIHDNSAGNLPSASISGGGIGGGAGDDARLRIRRNRVANNQTSSGLDQATGSGAFLNASGNSSVVFTDNWLVGNRHLGDFSCVGASLAFWQSEAAAARARRNVILDNKAPNTGFCENVSVIGNGTGSVAFTDNLIVGGDGPAVAGLAFGETSNLVLANSTIVDHPVGFAGFSDGGAFIVANNALHDVDEPTNFSSAGIDEIANLVLPASAFRSVASGDYRPTASSAAVDAGSGAIFNLGPQDLDGNPRSLGGGIDVGAYEFVGGACIPDEETLCLLDGRFEVKVSWRDYQDGTGPGREVDPANLLAPSDDSGLLYFFDADNWEFLVKIIDGCGFNQRYWVYGAATTDVEYSLTVRDTQTEETANYFNPLGTRSPAITDSRAFATCP